MKQQSTWILYGLMILLWSCGNKESVTNSIAAENGYVPLKEATVLSTQDYIAWVRDVDNGLKKEKTIDDLLFSVQYKPYEYIVCLEEKKEALQDSLVKKKTEELSNMQYYDFKISLTEGSGELLKHQITSPQQYDQRINYFAFGMQKDIQLVEGTDTLPCSLYHFERTYDIAPSSTCLLGFPVNTKKSSTEKTLLVYDRTFNKGLLKFTFFTDALKKQPKLKTL